MLAWITSNFTTILIGALFLAVVVWAVYVLRRDKKKGNSPCGCSGCKGCAMEGRCHPKGKEKE